MVKDNNGCSYGKVSRNMIENITTEYKEFRDEIRKEFSDLKETNTKLYNHLSDRLPRWAVVIGGIGLMFFSSFIGFLISRLAQ